MTKYYIVEHPVDVPNCALGGGWESGSQIQKNTEGPLTDRKNPLGVHTKPLLGGTDKAKTVSWVYFTEFG